MTFQPLTFACMKCGNVVRLGKPKQFGSCGCGQANGDAGDGEYYRLGGQARGMTTRRPKGSVKAIVTAAYDQKMTVPELVKLSGISRYTIYNAATRLGFKLKPARR